MSGPCEPKAHSKNIAASGALAERSGRTALFGGFVSYAEYEGSSSPVSCGISPAGGS